MEESIGTAESQAAPPQTDGMHVLFEDDFSGPLSISKTGAGTTYASLKPDWPNGAEFGEAIFADSTDQVNPFSILGDDHLRIRVSKAPEGYVDPQGWNRKYIGGLLSSVRLDGTGIAATNGYFEARIQMPAGKGAWPAFWLMSQNSTGAEHLSSTAELDTVEAYGHDPDGACQAKHWWVGSPNLIKPIVPLTISLMVITHQPGTHMEPKLRQRKSSIISITLKYGVMHLSSRRIRRCILC